MLLTLLLACAKVPAPPAAGALAPCWSSPNCVSTQAAQTDKVHYHPPQQARPGLDLAAIEVAVLQLPGCEVTHRDAEHLTAICHTPSGLFTDDLHVLLVDGTIHARSSSRIGYDDLGVNRERLTALFDALH